MRDDDSAADNAERLASALDGPADVVVNPLFGVPATAALGLLGSRGRLVDITPEQRARALHEVLRHAAAGDIEVSHDVVPLEDAPSAWLCMADGSARARPVLAVG